MSVSNENPKIQPGLSFLAFKARLQSGDVAGDIPWQRAYSLSGEAFAGHPEFHQEMESELAALQASHHGQGLFRGIVLNDDRVRPVPIGKDERTSALSASFDPIKDMVSFPVYMFEPERRAQMLERVKDFPLWEERLQDVKITLLHEGDHAVQWGADYPYHQHTKFENKLRRGCHESLAVNRENAYRKEEGLTLRDGFVDSTELDARMVAIKEKYSETDNREISVNMYKKIRNLATTSVLLNQECGSDISFAQANEQVVTRTIEMLKLAGITKVQTEMASNPTSVEEDKTPVTGELESPVTPATNSTSEAMRTGTSLIK